MKQCLAIFALSAVAMASGCSAFRNQSTVHTQLTVTATEARDGHNDPELTGYPYRLVAIVDMEETDIAFVRLNEDDDPIRLEQGEWVDVTPGGSEPTQRMRLIGVDAQQNVATIAYEYDVEAGVPILGGF